MILKGFVVFFGFLDLLLRINWILFFYYLWVEFKYWIEYGGSNVF